MFVQKRCWRFGRPCRCICHPGNPTKTRFESGLCLLCTSYGPCHQVWEIWLCWVLSALCGGIWVCPNVHERPDRSSLVPPQCVQTRCHRREREPHEAESPEQHWLGLIGLQFSFGHGLGAVHEVPIGTKVNSEQFITLLSERYLPELRAWYADDTDIRWQQDGAPSHRSETTTSYLKGPGTGKIEQVPWPAASPDLNVLDWCVQGQIKRHRVVDSCCAWSRT